MADWQPGTPFVPQARDERPRVLTEENLRALDVVRPPQRLTGVRLEQRTTATDRLEQALSDAKQRLATKKLGFRQPRCAKVGHASTFSALNLDFCPRTLSQGDTSLDLDRVQVAARSLRQGALQQDPALGLGATEPSLVPKDEEAEETDHEEDDDVDGDFSTDEEEEEESGEVLSPPSYFRKPCGLRSSSASTLAPDSAFRSFASTDDNSRPVTARISGRTKIDKVYEYHIKVTDGERHWMVHRRYTQFEQLNDEIGAQATLPSLPTKSTVRNRLSKKFREKRQQALDLYLKSACAADPSSSRWESLRHFLSVDADLDPSNLPSKTSEASVVVRFSDQYAQRLDTIVEDHHFRDTSFPC